MKLKVNRNKNLSKFLITCLILSCFVGMFSLLPSTSALVTILNLTGTTTGIAMYVDHPSAVSQNSAEGTVFVAGATGYLSSVNFYGYRGSTTTGTLILRLANVTGTVDVDGIPDDVLTSSNEIDITTMETSVAWHTITFDGSYQIISGQTYALYAEVNDIGGGGTPLVQLRYATSTQVNASRFSYHNGGWVYDNTTPFAFQIYGNSEPAATPTPTPPPATATPAPTGLPVGTAILAVDAYADCNVSWNIQGSTQTQYEGIFSLPVGTVIEMTCTPDEGYYFYYWWATWDDGSTQFSLNPLHFTIYEDISLTGFVDAVDLAELKTVTLQDSTGGRTYADYTPENWTGSIRFFAGTYQLGENSSLTIGGLPNTSYQFYRLTFAWNIAGVSLSSVEYESPVTVEIIGTLTAKAYFTQSSLFPTPSTSGDAGTLGTVLTLLTSGEMISLFIMIIVGAVGYYMAGPWGFFAGINAAAILLYMGEVFPLWGVVVLIIVDGLMLYGKVSASRSTSGHIGE